MSGMILIKTPSAEMNALLNETDTAKALFENLPFEGTGRRWGDEIYFTIDLDLPPENSRETVAKGDLGYWPEGSGFCIFFGPTPVSGEDEIRPASLVNIFGKVEGDPENFRSFKDGQKVIIEKA